MIINPPHISQLLRAYKAILFLQPNTTNLTIFLSQLFARYIGHPDYKLFQKTYNLYLQQIPVEIAKQAWGINQAAFAAYLKPITTQP